MRRTQGGRRGEDLLATELGTAAADLLAQLVRINTSNPPGNEQPAAELLAQYLASAGLDVDVIPLAPQRANIRAVWRGRGKRPALLLCGHLDTVPPSETPWRFSPFNGAIVDGRLYGRGAADMKGGVAGLATAIAELARTGHRLSGDVVFLGTAGEEVDCLGARQFMEAGDITGIGHILVAEPTGLEPCIGHRGALWLELATVGRTAHASMPQAGVNSVDHMVRLLSRLIEEGPGTEAHPLMGEPSLAITSVRGGTEVNVLPDQCVATVDWRTTPGQSHPGLLQRVEALIARAGREIADFQCTVRVLADRPPVETPLDADIVHAALRVGNQLLGRQLSLGAAPYFTDASVLAVPHSLPTLVWGPGELAQAHSTDEWVDLGQVALAAELYAALAAELLG